MNRRTSLALARLLPLGVLSLAALAGCDHDTLPTALAPDGAVFTQLTSSSAPVVNSLDDVVDTDGCTESHCSLREAIAFADAGATITFSVTETITLTQGQLTINKNLTITGPGASSLTVSGNNSSRGFLIDRASVAISGLTVTGGQPPLDPGSVVHGGGIYVMEGTLALDLAVVKGNRAHYGGGISADWGSTVTITRSTISGNAAEPIDDDGEPSYGEGGGVSNINSTVTIEASTVTGNQARNGGGIHSTGGGTTIRNSTVSGNTSSEGGGGIYNLFAAGIAFSTITGNQAGSYGGGVFAGATTDVEGSLIWGNTSGSANTTDDVAAPESSDILYNSKGYNLIGAAGVNVNLSTEFSSEGDQIGVTDPGLGSLADNGGPTWTHALDSGSPAIDRIPSGTIGCGTDPATDQRGVTRSQGSGCDIGAYERESTVGPYTLSTAVDPEGSGIVTGAGTYDSGIEVTVTATANSGYTFSHWSGACAGSESCRVIMDADKSVTAHFTQTASSFTASCTFTVHPRSGNHTVAVAWANAEPGVTLIQLTDGRTVSKQMAPTPTGSWSTNVKAAPTYGVWGGEGRKDSTIVLVPAGTACVLQN